MRYDDENYDDRPTCLQCGERINSNDMFTPKHELRHDSDAEFCSDTCEEKYQDKTFEIQTNWWTNFDPDLFEQVVERKKAELKASHPDRVRKMNEDFEQYLKNKK